MITNLIYFIEAIFDKYECNSKIANNLKPYIEAIRNQKEINDKKNKLPQIEEMNLNKFNAETQKEDKELYIKVLEDKINEFEKIEDTAKLKRAFYIAIVAGIISATIGNIHKVKEVFDYNFFIIAIFIMLLIFFTNMVILLFQFDSVRGYYSGMYSEFREESKKEKAYFLYLYRKMKWVQLYSNQDVSYILNIEDYIKSFFILITLLAFIFIFI